MIRPLVAVETVTPGDRLVDQRLDETGRNVDEGIVVDGAGFEQAHGLAGVDQASRQHAAGRAGADDDVIELFHAGSLLTGSWSSRLAEAAEA